jgi:N-acetylmuramoyl-L-alanine amidase
MTTRTSARSLLALALLAACGGPPRPQPAPPPAAGPETSTLRPGEAPPIRNALPPVPARSGAPRIEVMYPGENAALTAADSNFIFGSVGTGGASLTINGAAVDVAANGAFLGFVPVPADGVYRLRASAGGQTAQLERRVRVPGGRGGGRASAGIVGGSILPRGTIAGTEGEAVTVRFRGSPGARARIVFPDGSSVPLVERRTVERDEGFMQDRASVPREFTEYAGSFALSQPLAARDTAVRAPTLAGSGGRTGTAMIEYVLDGRTVREPLELSAAVLRAGETRTGVAASARPDRMVIGTALPGSGTPYHWTFPNGTRFTITGEREGAYRVRLSGDQSVWVPAGDVRLEPAGAPAVTGTVGAVRIDPAPGWIDVRLSTSDRLPFEVRAEDDALTISVYGAESRTNWLHYGHADPLVRRAEWQQPRDDLYTVRLELAERVWGWRSFWDESGALVVRVRRPPRIDPRMPMRALRIAIDAGHPPGGAIGPTGLTEAEANLAISKHLVRMLRDAGAEVLETRPDAQAVDLGARPLRATTEDAHLLVSVHNNAFPDGVNPWENNGTTVFYNQPQSLDLARRMQEEILAEMGLRDLGIARADLALTRPTWMPSVLTETMFLMIPQQEAALRDPAVHERIAAAHFRAIRAFLEARARR